MSAGIALDHGCDAREVHLTTCLLVRTVAPIKGPEQAFLELQFSDSPEVRSLALEYPLGSLAK